MSGTTNAIIKPLIDRELAILASLINREELMSKDTFEALRKAGCSIEPTGLRVTCEPPVLDTDADFLVQIPPHNRAIVAEVVGSLEADGFGLEGGEHYQEALAGTFMSFRKGKVNLIVSANDDFCRRHRAATALCKRLNLLNKSDRVAVFVAVLYGNIKAETVN